MRQVFYPGVRAETIAITGGDAHHLAHVMRAQIGDAITVVDAAGQAAEMVVTALTRDVVHLRRPKGGGIGHRMRVPHRDGARRCAL